MSGVCAPGPNRGPRPRNLAPQSPEGLQCPPEPLESAAPKEVS